MTQAITATGLKGFLQWVQQDQPAIYAATAAKIAKAVPKGFSGFNGSVLQSMRLAQGRRSMKLRGYSLGSCCGSTCGMLQSVSSSCASIPMPVVGCLDTSCAANAGTTCSTSLTGIANIISATSSAVLNAQQQATYNSMVQSQLSRAQQGLQPLVLSSAAAGVPTVSGLAGSSTSTLVLFGGGALLLWLLLGRK